MNKKDIENRQDIELLVSSFYEKAVLDEAIGYFFDEVRKDNWDSHVQIICNFWESTLLGAMNYQGNPMTKHFELHRRFPMTKAHFDRWFELWSETVMELFAGQVAEDAVFRAKSISGLMAYQVTSH